MMRLLVALMLLANMAFSQGNNCPAFPLCNTASFSDTPNGVGTQELGLSNQGCLSGEHQSVWLQVTVQTSGVMVFRINPNAADDFDFAVWGPNSPCPPTTLPIRCSWAAGSGNTGIRAASGDVTENAFGDGWVDPINVTAGQTYLILIDNFSINLGFQLDWNFGANNTTATFTCALLPIELLDFKVTEQNKSNLVSWSTAMENNVADFCVERSRDGMSWSEIARVKATNSQRMHRYEIDDLHFDSGVNYYRLNELDINGTVNTFRIVSVSNRERLVHVKVINMLGQEVAPNYKGVVFYVYDDGSVVKKVQE